MQVKEGHVQHVVTLHPDILECLHNLSFYEKRVEAETLESLIEILCILQSWSFPVYNNLFALCSSLLKLDHSKLLSLLNFFRRHYEL